MKIKNYFAVSPALIKENFKMHWYIPALTFLAYFFTCIFCIISGLGNSHGRMPSNMIQNDLQNQNALLCLLMVAVPFVTACIIMSYQHTPEKAFAFSSQPYSRSRLFNTQIFTGWIMMILPMIATALLYCAFYGATVVGLDAAGVETTDINDIVKAEHIYTIATVWKWCFSETAIITFFYGMFVLAGSIVGTTAIQILGSAVFFGVIPLFVVLAEGYCDEFLIGYSSMPDWMSNATVYSNPILSMIALGWDEGMAFKTYIIYFLVGILFLILSKFAVQRAKLEHVGDGMIFDIIEELSTWLVTVIGSLVFGLGFVSIEHSKALAVIGMLIGAVITFTVTKIIINRTIKVFDKRNFKSFAAFLVILAVLMSLLIFDIQGFKNRVPDESRIESVDVSNMVDSFDDGWIRWVDHAYYMAEDDIFSDYDLSRDLLLKDEESKAAVTALHNYIVENKAYIDTENTYATYYEYDDSALYQEGAENVTEGVTFRYNMKDGTYFTRRFRIILDENSIQLINDVVTLPEYKEKIKAKDIIDNLKDAEMQLNVNMYKIVAGEHFTADTEINYDNTEYKTYGIRSEDIPLIAEALDMDIEERNYIDGDSKYDSCYDIGKWVDSGYNFLSAELQVGYRVKEGQPQPVGTANAASEEYTDWTSIQLSSAYRHTMETIESLGYFDDDRAIIGSGGSVALY